MSIGIWLGIDPGEKRIGVARSDPLGMLAHPVSVVGSQAELVQLIQETSDESSLAGVVVGLPRNMDGSIGPIAQRSLQLVRELRERLPVPFRLWDERLSSRHVERVLDEGRKRRRGEAIDDRAAAALLQTFLDAGCPEIADPPEYDPPQPDGSP